jgi:nitrogen regulatory protein P-II 1
MKLITAIIKPHVLDNVRDALQQDGVRGFAVTQAKRCGRRKGHTEIYRGAEYSVDCVPKIKTEIVTPDDWLEQIAQNINKSARMGTIGDGKFLINSSKKAVQIPTGQARTGAPA